MKLKMESLHTIMRALDMYEASTDTSVIESAKCPPIEKTLRVELARLKLKQEKK